MNDKALAELFYDAARISHQRETRRDHSLIYGSGQSRCLLTVSGLGPVSQRRRRRAADNGATGKLLEVLTAQQREQFAEILTVIKEHYQELDKQNL